jgi:hypothetical protein
MMWTRDHGLGNVEGGCKWGGEEDWVDGSLNVVVSLIRKHSSLENNLSVLDYFATLVCFTLLYFA